MARWFTVLAVVAILTAPYVANAQSSPDQARIDALIRKLGNSSFVQRELAAKELEKIGEPALDPLRKAAKTDDVETSRRLKELIRTFEERAITKQILEPKDVHLNVTDVTVQQAIAELAGRSGYPMQFIGDATKVAGKKITLDTGKVTYWQAVERLCEEAGLMERFDPVKSTTTSSGTILRSPYIPPQKVVNGPLFLTPRGNEKSHVSLNGAVKTELRLSRDPATKDIVATFLVSVEPRLQNAGLAAKPRLDKAFDQDGRGLVQTEPAKAEPAANRNIDMDLVEYLGGVPQVTSRAVQVRFKDDRAATRSLKELAGQLTIDVDLQNETIARLPNLLNASGKSADGANGGTLKVGSVKKNDNGSIEIQVALENLGPSPFGNNVVINGNNIVIRGNVNLGGIVINGGGVKVNGGGANNLPDLVDAKGQKFRIASLQNDSTNISGGSISRSATIVFSPNPGQAEPRDLILFGTRTYSVGTPFRFENLQVP